MTTYKKLQRHEYEFHINLKGKLPLDFVKSTLFKMIYSYSSDEGHSIVKVGEPTISTYLDWSSYRVSVTFSDQP